jgi:hypothetical protein
MHTIGFENCKLMFSLIQVLHIYDKWMPMIIKYRHRSNKTALFKIYGISIH